MTQPSPFDPEIWLRNLFACKAVQQGEVIRRKKRDVERFAGLDTFFIEINRRGFQVVENAGQFVIFCNQEPIRRCRGPEFLKEFNPKSSQDFAPSTQPRLPQRPNL